MSSAADARRLLVTGFAAAGLFGLLSTAEAYRFGPTVEALGPEAVQFDSSKDACDMPHYPDAPARAFRDNQGRIQVNISQGKPPLVTTSGAVMNQGNRRLIGPTLKDAVSEQLAPDGRLCAHNVTHTNPYMPNSIPGAPQPAAAWPPPLAYDPSNPANFHDREWIASTWTTDGRTVYALLHDNFQGWRDLNGDGVEPDRCPGVPPDEFASKCWYGSVTIAKSTNAGATYGTTETAPRWLHQDQPFYSSPSRHLVASIPYRYAPAGGRQGIPPPTNIIKKVPEDGYYYFLFHVLPDRVPEGKSGVCLARTRDLDVPTSWRGWDGSRFTVTFVNPYVSTDLPADHLCEPVSRATLGQFSARSVTYNTYLRKYMLVAQDRRFEPARNEMVAGVYYSLSDDLITWGKPKLLMEAPSSGEWETVTCADPDPVGYPVILDPDDPAASLSSSERNFYQPDRSALLYFTRYNRDLDAPGCPPIDDDRDLVRVPIRFSGGPG